MCLFMGINGLFSMFKLPGDVLAMEKISSNISKTSLVNIG